MRRSRFVRTSARILLAALLFAQGALALAGCNMPERAPAAAISTSGLPCHEQDVEATLCLVHCLAGDQRLDKPAFFVPLVGAAPVLAWRLLPAPPRMVMARARLIAPPAAAPPRILFQTLLI
jgi:hypothetical protein